ncbi:hypothetical protein F8388_001424 [Cannabis sativa]|uniref:Dof zinc finger protein n=1 Tax=Cannabis sativa TaxID=3483 RepID=A0A7J6GMM8_CANSA|nr:hypothetical protein F8388_001424 [Cannabis sativa]
MMFTIADMDQNNQMFHQFPTTLTDQIDKRWKPSIEIAPNCPRCASSNTKFCYYNNYSLSQPRYFCKGCRRYWTKGGSLRNVPVGGGYRKNRRSKSSNKINHGRKSNNYSPDSTELSESSNGDSSSGSGSDIDLAAVFANFLNQNPESSSNKAAAAVHSSISSNNCNPRKEGSSSSIITDQTLQIQQCLVLEETELVEELLLDPECNQFGFQNLVGNDEDVQVNGEDIFWSNSTAAAAAAVAAAETMPSYNNNNNNNNNNIQELESFPSTNLVNDIWNSFDFSGFEIFSRS